MYHSVSDCSSLSTFQYVVTMVGNMMSWCVSKAFVSQVTHVLLFPDLRIVHTF